MQKRRYLVLAAAVLCFTTQVDILFGTNANQNINIRVGLPLTAMDDG
jgi:hypothetical protein